MKMRITQLERHSHINPGERVGVEDDDIDDDDDDGSRQGECSPKIRASQGNEENDI